MYDFLILGGDERQAYLKEILSEQGYTVEGDLIAADAGIMPACSKLCEPVIQGENLQRTGLVEKIINSIGDKEKVFEDIKAAQAILAPVPFLNKAGKLNHRAGNIDISPDEIYEGMHPGEYLFAGCIPEWFMLKCAKREIRCYDYMKDEAVAVSNAVATAEGIIAEAVMKYKGTLHGCKCLVTGFGRCAKVLADKLKGMNAHVSICVRKNTDEVWAESMGYSAFNFHELERNIESFPVIFNTVPKKVFDRELLAKMRKNVMIFDIASAPGGVDYDVAERMGIEAAIYPSLPGKYSPEASARILASAVKRVMKINH